MILIQDIVTEREGGRFIARLSAGPLENETRKILGAGSELKHIPIIGGFLLDYAESEIRPAIRITHITAEYNGEFKVLSRREYDLESVHKAIEELIR